MRMGILKKIKRRFGMAKRFKREKAGAFIDDNKIFVEEIAERVAKEDIEEMVEIEEVIPEGKISKEEFLISKGLHERPNSHMAITAWEEYKAS
jgi:hypothetical protein